MGEEGVVFIYEPGAKKRTYKRWYVLPSSYVLQNSYVRPYVHLFLLPILYVPSYVRLYGRWYVLPNLYGRLYVHLYVLPNLYVY